MRIAAITKFKHGTMHNILRDVGWTQRELSKRSGLCITVVGNIINLKRRPTETQANAIQRAFGEIGVFFDPVSEWPEAFKGFGKSITLEQVRDVDADRLLVFEQFYTNTITAPTPYTELEDKERAEILESELQKLGPREAAVIQARCDFNIGDRDKTWDEVGKKFGVTRERVRQIHNMAMRKVLSTMMRHEQI